MMSHPLRAEAAAPGAPTRPVLATPATRRLARENGVNLTHVRGTGPAGRVTSEDVQTFIASGNQGARKHAFVSSIAHATHMDEADVTVVEASLGQAAEQADGMGVGPMLTAYLVKAVVTALKQHPVFNASLDEAAGEIVYKQYLHVGIVLESPGGLLVPVIRHADRKRVAELVREIAELVEKSRAGKLSNEETQGGSFALTNIGGIGGTAFTPVIHWPEVAALGIACIQDRPMMRDGVLVNRRMLPLILTFDQRSADAVQAARFMNEVKRLVENPLLLMLEG
jgi:pyruvate dehydrogenase E2 component (dihydrolipoamide acetyltransferase)